MPYIEPEERPEQPLRPQITGPIGWEDDSLPWSLRLFRTLGATFSPLGSLHAVANGQVSPAVRFMLFSTLPFMLLWAIVPFTHRLTFGPSFAVGVIPGTLPIELDVVRAMAIGLVLSGVTQLSWALPFVSLASAFSNGSRPEDPKRAAWRTALYRMWVVPFGMMLFTLVTWGLPEKPSQFAIELTVLSCQMLPRMLILVHCHVMARYLGASGLGALAVSVVPLIVQTAVLLSVDRVAFKLLPPMPVR